MTPERFAPPQGTTSGPAKPVPPWSLKDAPPQAGATNPTTLELLRGSDMAGLLSIGARAMLANTAALQTISQNIANANTPGYSRQSARDDNLA